MRDLTKQTDAMLLLTMPLHLLVEYLFPLFPSSSSRIPLAGRTVLGNPMSFFILEDSSLGKRKIEPVVFVARLIPGRSSPYFGKWKEESRYQHQLE